MGLSLAHTPHSPPQPSSPHSTPSHSGVHTVSGVTSPPSPLLQDPAMIARTDTDRMMLIFSLVLLMSTPQT